MTAYVNRNGLFVPEQDRLKAFRAHHGISEPSLEDEQKALRDLKDELGNAIIAVSKKYERLFGSEQQGAGALQTAMIAAIDVAAQGLAAYNGLRSAAATLRAVAVKVENAPLNQAPAAPAPGGVATPSD